mgnify:CR=1 FL=1
MRMYILIREDVPLGLAITAAAHASLACYLKYQDTEEVASWLAGPFRKVVCRVSAGEFEKAKGEKEFVVLTESALEGAETAIAFKPRVEWPKYFKYFRLFK